MTCAKKVVTCQIIDLNGNVFHGENSCRTPQKVCPRLPDEDYTKCKTICDQPGHAEEVALMVARGVGMSLKGATAYMQGTTHFCENCQKQLFNAGVTFLTRGMPYDCFKT